MLQIDRDRLHGKADLGQSAVVYRNHRWRIDVDTDDLIFHLKVRRAQSDATHMLAVSHHFSQHVGRLVAFSIFVKCHLI